MRNSKKLPLKSFLDAVEQRLAACSMAELRSILRAMAQQTPPSGRQAFLDQLKARAEIDETVQEALRQADLLADIDDTVQELSAELENASEDWDSWREWDEEDSLGPYESFVDPLSELFDRADATFDNGDLALAREAYEKLFEALSLEDDFGRGVRESDLEDLDVRESRARYLRAVYETESPERRPAVLFERLDEPQWSSFGSDEPSMMLEDLLGISPRSLPDKGRFLDDWIAYLKTREEFRADAWLREAVRLAKGTQGLEELARNEGRQRPRAYLDWAADLEAQSKHHEAMDAAREGLEALPAEMPIRAAIADELCKAATALEDHDALQDGRWTAFQAEPTVVRLVQLWETVHDSEVRSEWMGRAARHAEERLEHADPQQISGFGPDHATRPIQVDRSVLAHAHLLGGEWDAARELVAGDQVLGWSTGGRAQALVMSFFLVALSGKTPDEVPTNLRQVWRRALGSIDVFSRFSEQLGTTSEGLNLSERLDSLYSELLLNSEALPEDKQQAYLDWCLDLAKQRVDGIVRGQHRRSYNKAAELVTACTEVLRLRGNEQQARALLEGVRSRYPRHSSFQREMRAATGQSL